MKWINLVSEEQLDTIKQISSEHDIVIFKHSTRCSISATALNHLEREWDSNQMQQVSIYFLDLIRYRGISNKIAEIFSIPHESPQLLLIRKGHCVYHDSHFDIRYESIKDQVIQKAS